MQHEFQNDAGYDTSKRLTENDKTRVRTEDATLLRISLLLLSSLLFFITESTMIRRNSVARYLSLACTIMCSFVTRTRD